MRVCLLGVGGCRGYFCVEDRARAWFSGTSFATDLGGSSNLSSMLTLILEVEEGSMATSVVHGLAGPKVKGNFLQKGWPPVRDRAALFPPLSPGLRPGARWWAARGSPLPC
jgi:hypothetical protein